MVFHTPLNLLIQNVNRQIPKFTVDDLQAIKLALMTYVSDLIWQLAN